MEPERWQRIEQLYYSALEREAEQRAAFLSEASANDAGLRQEVEVLLAANDQAGDFMAIPALEQEALNIASEQLSGMIGVEAGQEVSHYTILSRIGAGGMGEVFLAQDNILERRVALKLLPIGFTEDAERFNRFIREAKTASALNHPNIITIYEIGEASTALGKIQFIATEFIEGETLRTWVVDDETRLREVLNIAIQVASALAAAHRAGVVHRDVKPENVMVRPDGLVKVLDFGLAKLTSQPQGGVNADARRPVNAVETQPGMILGTLRYMSPEQARGRSVDARSDIFSLGVLLYELLTSRPLFAGETDADVVAAIIHEEAPPLAEHLSQVPPELERIVQKALAKNAERRYHDARDLQTDLQSLRQESELSARRASSTFASTDKPAALNSSGMTEPRFSMRQLLSGVVIALLIAGATWLMVRGTGQVETPPPESLKNVEVVTWQSAPGDGYSVGAFSHDGKWVAFTSTKGGAKNIWVKQSASGDAEASTKDRFENENPIWSPDGDEIAFISMRDGQFSIWRKPPFGGSPKRLMKLAMDEGNVKLERWSNNGSRIYYESNRNLFALNVNSGQTNQLTHLDSNEVIAFSLSVSVDEQHVAYVTRSDTGGATLNVLPLRGGTARTIAQMNGNARNTVWHPDGKRVFYSADVDGTYQIFVADMDGHKPVQLSLGEKDSMVLDVSADGSKLLYGSSREESDIWGVNVATGEEFTVASDLSSELWPNVSPINKTVAYQAIRNLSEGNNILHSAILTKPLDSSAQASVLTRDAALPVWSPDAILLAFLRITRGSYGLWTISADGGEERQLTTGSVNFSGNSILPYQRIETSHVDWSPDSRWLVYCSDRSGQSNLWLVAADGSSDTQLTNNADSNLELRCPLWSRDGKRLAYSSCASPVETEGKLTYSVWIREEETKTAKIIFESDSFLRIVGWMPGAQELILATLKSRLGTPTPVEVQLLRVSALTGAMHPIGMLPAAYLYNIQLAADGRLLAFSSHQDEKDNLWVLPVEGGKARKLTANIEGRRYFSSLAWSPDSRAIYFGKQVRYSQLWMITNLK